MRSIIDQILVALAVATSTFAVWFALQTPGHTATSSIYVRTSEKDTGAQQLSGSYQLNQVRSLAVLAHGSLVTRAALDATGVRMTQQKLSDSITVSALPQTVVVQLSVTSRQAAEARALCAAATKALITQGNRIQNEGSGGTGQTELMQISPAHSTPQPTPVVRAGLLCGLLGVLAGLALPTTPRRARRHLAEPAGDSSTETGAAR